MKLSVDQALSLWQRNRENFVKYVCVGGSTFLIDLGLLVVLHEVCHVPVVIAATISYWTSIVYNFAMNRYWTFETTRSLKHHAMAYGLLLLTNYIVTIAIIWALGLVGVTYTLAKILAVGISMSWTYVVYKKVIFV